MSRFTLRDLFWLTLVAGMGAGWWVDRRQLREEVVNYSIQLTVDRDFARQLWLLEQQLEKFGLRVDGRGGIVRAPSPPDEFNGQD